MKVDLLVHHHQTHIVNFFVGKRFLERCFQVGSDRL